MRLVGSTTCDCDAQILQLVLRMGPHSLCVSRSHLCRTRVFNRPPQSPRRNFPSSLPFDFLASAAFLLNDQKLMPSVAHLALDFKAAKRDIDCFLIWFGNCFILGADATGRLRRLGSNLGARGPHCICQQLS